MHHEMSAACGWWEAEGSYAKVITGVVCAFSQSQLRDLI